MKKQYLLLISSLVLTLSSCERNNSVKPIDATKTQLYVGIYEGGLESGGIYKIAQEFEKKYENVSIEDGKRGVEVFFTEGRYSDPMKDSMLDAAEEVYFDTAASTLYLHDNNKIVDISDLYSTPMNYDFVTKQTDPNGDSRTFYDIVRADRRDLYKAKDGKFYGYPGTSQFFGLVYDIDLFDEKNLYFNATGDFVKSKTDAKSAGPDGKIETEYDNGLPSTFDEFFKLCDKIVSLGMTPVMWGGTVQEYVNSLLSAIAADVDGKEQTELNYNYSGTATSLIDSISGDEITYKPETAITAKNGYELYRQEGRYYALKFLERLISNKNYYNYADATSPAFSNLDAQSQYLYSKESKTRKRTAMLVEGSWWNKEAAGTFMSMAAEFGEKDSQANRKLGLLPLPKATKEKVGEPFTVLERAVGDGFISASINPKKLDLAKSFVQFMFQNQSCKTYLEYDAQTRAVDFTITDDEYNALVPWAQTMYDLKKNAVIATMYSNSDIMRIYSSELWYSPNLWNSIVDGETHKYPTTAMINNKISGNAYFEGLSKYMNKAVWDSKFSSVIN